MYLPFYNIDLKITIADAIAFSICQAITIQSSVQVLTNSATVTLPRNYRKAVGMDGKAVEIGTKCILDFVKRGDAITIALGYDGSIATEFEGYVTKINAETPLILECEDEMYQLKQAKRIRKFIKSGTVLDILKAVIPAKYTIECNGDYAIGKWMVENATPYEVLEELREKAGIRAWFKNPTTLCVGMVVDFKAGKKHLFNFAENVRGGSTLKFERKEDNELEVTAKSKKKNGSETTVIVGKKGANTTVIHMPELSKTELELWANQIYKSRCFDGFRGDFSSWCLPRTKAGEVADLTRPLYRDRHQDGRYFIEAVKIDVNASDGIKRTNTLSYRL
jgi:hypothetical protein